MRFLTVCVLGLLLGQGGSIVGDLPAKYRSKAPVGDTVVGRVDGVAIKASDVESLLWEWRGTEAIQELENYQLIRAEAARTRTEVSDSDIETNINAGLEQFRVQRGLPTLTAAEAALAQTGMTRSRLYLRMRNQLLVQKMIERSFVPKGMVKVSTIIFRFKDATAAAMSDALTRSQTAYDRLQKGDSWDAVYAANVKEPAAAGTKGLVGWRDLAVFPPPVAEELQKLKPGQITKPAQTENGMQIFRLDLLGADAKGPDLKELKDAYMVAGQNQLMLRLTKQAKIESLWPPAGTP